MATTWSTARCPNCAAPLAMRVPMAPGVRWFPCPRCHAPVPVIAAMNPPPLFTWEVYPGAYPPPPPVRLPTRPMGRLATIALVAACLVLVGVSGALIVGGAEALGPSNYSLRGSVVANGGSSSVGGASLHLTSESGWQSTLYADAAGVFTFHGIPAGGATLNVTAPGFELLSVVLFFSPAYEATGAGPNGLVLELVNGSSANASTVYETPFPTVESFVSSLWSAGVLLLIAAIVVGVGAIMAYRDRRPTVGLAGGVAAALAPAALSLLGIFSAFPLAIAPAAAAVGLGTVGAILELAPVLSAGRTPDSG